MDNQLTTYSNLPRLSVVRLTDRLDMTIAVDCGVQPQTKQIVCYEYSDEFIPFAMDMPKYTMGALISNKCPLFY